MSVDRLPFIKFLYLRLLPCNVVADYEAEEAAGILDLDMTRSIKRRRALYETRAELETRRKEGLENRVGTRLSCVIIINMVLFRHSNVCIQTLLWLKKVYV